MEWVIIIGVGFLLLVVINVAYVANQEKKKAANEERLATEHKLDEVFVFKHPTTLSSPTPFMLRRGVTEVAGDRYMVGVKWEDERIFFGRLNDPFEIGFAEIAEIELVRDDQSITKTNRGSQLAGAAIGAVALGGVGAIIGGLSGSSNTKNKVKSIDIQIETEHDRALRFRVNYFKSAVKAGDKSDGIVVQQSAPEAERWYSILQRAMKQAQAKSAEAQPVPIDNSIESRLEKLWALKESGALTAEEYVTQKQKLLAER
ncbi:MAG: SHOCT domain-containing protein [Hyphomonadaceae bacterium]